MGVGGSTPRAGPFTLRKETRYPLYRRPGGPHGRSGRVRKITPLPGFDPRTVQPVASRYTDWAILAPIQYRYIPVYCVQVCITRGTVRDWDVVLVIHTCTQWTGMYIPISTAGLQNMQLIIYTTNGPKLMTMLLLLLLLLFFWYRVYIKDIQ